MTDSDTPGRRARKRASTLDALAENAIRLFHSHGYEAVTMEQIALEADVAKGTLYNHFATKEAVLAHWIHAQLAIDMAHLGPRIEREPHFAPAISVMLDASAAWCEAHRAWIAPYLRFRFLSFTGVEREAGTSSPSDHIDGFAMLIGRAQHTGELRNDLAASHLATLLHHLYLGALMRWLATPELDLQEEFAAIVKLFIEGAACPSAPTVKSRKS
ncbi:TetR family transcriptional regulator [Paraburkholderia ginsengiterrae]|uniref:TetR family transcriptional regulator n=1 Tax=Paraburkholderia ginsengiterrae TaxID=1462993 RepID=A0A1A9N9M7_9BURK|nr:TetR/AcrR family transcriptional regulator [Paraburkholderia ginsengiterrae]OAJ57138.1 TetR family transcriptional regulator [Paraburkholderia ginsengiterrae]OAJ61391.1 TetR family transcriptional regulator [Paraburkholderia ginsengiterrae]